MHLAQLQNDHEVWVNDNFPGQQPWEPLLGLQEEVGELAHAHLKHHQGIRGMDDEAAAIAAKEDAVGDIVIYLASYCNANDLDLDKCVRRAWDEVSKRDWVKDPQKGGT